MFDARLLKVHEVMTTDVYFIQPDTTLLEAQKVFQANAFHHLPVISDGHLQGILSKSDILLISNAFPLDDPEARNKNNEPLLARMLAEEVMTKHVVKLRPDMALGVAVGIFLENLFHAMPVVDNEGNLLGILSWLDLIRVAYVPQQQLG
ncbi:MAG: CBS domain-containing protein [Saprospiraceae bacterium]|nr:CBS domain-containing protein [Saprospiraceae bacterium]